MRNAQLPKSPKAQNFQKLKSPKAQNSQKPKSPKTTGSSPAAGDPAAPQFGLSIMSLLEVEQRRSRRKKKPSQYHRALNTSPVSTLHPDQILTFLDWCRLNRISERTGRRILQSGNGPVVTQLSNWRVGITVANNALWQQSRERTSPQTPRHKQQGAASPKAASSPKRRARTDQLGLPAE